MARDAGQAQKKQCPTIEAEHLVKLLFPNAQTLSPAFSLGVLGSSFCQFLWISFSIRSRLLRTLAVAAHSRVAHHHLSSNLYMPTFVIVIP
jgi:hypothetical protein